MKKLYVLLFFFSLFVGTDAVAQTIRYVKAGASGNGSSWAAASGDLQAMINASAANDEVWVAAGIYKPTEKVQATLTDGTATTDRDKSFVLIAGVKVYGGFNGTESNLLARNFTTNLTVLSGDLNNDNQASDGDCYHIIVSKNSSDGALLDGFTLQHGYANGAGTIGTASATSTVSLSQNTGAAVCTRGTTTQITFQNVIIRDNYASGNGGAVYQRTGGTAKQFSFVNVKFINNSSGAAGGAIYAYPSINTPILDISDCTFENNTAVGSGGAIYFYGAVSSIFNVTNSTFTSNSSTGGSGGHIYHSAYTLNIAGTTFKDGYSNTTAGAVYVSSSATSLKIENSTFDANKSAGSSGAIYLGTNSATNNTIDKCLFTGNESVTSAGAIYFYSNNTNISNTKFYGNKATVSGGAIFLYGLSTALSSPQFVNNVFL